MEPGKEMDGFAVIEQGEDQCGLHSMWAARRWQQLQTQGKGYSESAPSSPTPALMPHGWAGSKLPSQS